MASEESFLLVSLEESKAKKLAQVISNDTSRKILDALAKGDLTETQISKDLKIPISTVHYNLKALTDANLVKVEEFHYSEKGKEVNHYSLANKIIIIAPKETKGLKAALKKFLPLTLLAIGGSLLLYLIEFISTPKSLGMESVALKAAPMMADAATQGASATQEIAPVTPLPFAVWFLFGALFVVLLYLLFEIIASKRKS